MSSINSVVVSGNLVKDAELRQSANGLEILNFTVAVNEKRKDATGGWEDYASFLNWTYFGKHALAIATYLKKGTFVVVSGKVTQNRWGEGEAKKSKTSFIAQNVEFRSNKATSQPAQKPQPQRVENFDDDIPF